MSILTTADTWQYADEIHVCRWCGCYHGPLCPSVKAYEFHPDGVTVKRVEFHEPKPTHAHPEGLDA